MLVFTGGEGLAPQGIIPLPVDISADEVRFQMLSHSIPLILNFNNQSKHLIQSLPIKVIPALRICYTFPNRYLLFPSLPSPSLLYFYQLNHLTHSEN